MRDGVFENQNTVSRCGTGVLKTEYFKLLLLCLINEFSGSHHQNVKVVEPPLVTGDNHIGMTWQCRQILHSILVVVGPKPYCVQKLASVYRLTSSIWHNASTLLSIMSELKAFFKIYAQLTMVSAEAEALIIVLCG